MSDFDRDWDLAISIEPWLRDRGYGLVETRGPEGMSQGLRHYRGSTAEIVVWADRGQWFIDVRPAGAPSGRYDFGVWSIVLGAPVQFYADPLDFSTAWQLRPQLAYLKGHLAEIESACAPGNLVATLAKLRDAQHATAAFPVT